MFEQDARFPGVFGQDQEARDKAVGLIEAPRGTLFHHYQVDDNDQVTMANLIVSTTNNNTPMNLAVEKARNVGIGAVVLFIVRPSVYDRDAEDPRYAEGRASSEGRLMADAVSWARGRWPAIAGLVLYLVTWTGLFYVLPRVPEALKQGAADASNA